MTKTCENCTRTFDQNQTEPRKAGHGKEANDIYEQRRPNSNLCEECLFNEIHSELDKSKAPQD